MQCVWLDSINTLFFAISKSVWLQFYFFSFEVEFVLCLYKKKVEYLGNSDVLL